MFKIHVFTFVNSGEAPVGRTDVIAFETKEETDLASANFEKKNGIYIIYRVVKMY